MQNLRLPQRCLGEKVHEFPEQTCADLAPDLTPYLEGTRMEGQLLGRTQLMHRRLPSHLARVDMIFRQRDDL